ncbi:HutD family protein [Peptoniphilus obesi]|uniref:HutD family protein n=1 Tax=Peptoniphilus obesi TaxID=1472765 RepID=UPI0004AE34A9|nr:HutD family protein [Peptoniphilus obesi]
MKVKNKNDFKTSTWAGGETDEIVICPEGDDFKNRKFDYRISSATCNLDSSEFSEYGGFTRFITPLDKVLKLNHMGKKIDLEPFEVYKFDGSDQMSSHSKVRDFNLIVKNGLEADLYKESIDGEKEFKNDHEKMLIFNYDSNLKYDQNTFENMSLIELDKGESIVIKGQGKLLISVIK